MKKSVFVQLLEHFQQRYYGQYHREFESNYGENLPILTNLCRDLLTKEIDSFFDKMPQEWYKDKDVTLPMFYSEVMKRFNKINLADIAKMLGGLCKEIPRSEPKRY